jgi:hypothetical protein
MLKLILTAALILGGFTAAQSGQPHPQMFEFLLDQANEHQARDYDDCSVVQGHCEHGRTWVIGDDTWQIVTQVDGQPVQRARLTRQNACGVDIARWNFPNGMFAYRVREEQDPNKRWNLLDMDDILADHDRAAYPSTGLDTSSPCPFDGVQIQFQRWVSHGDYVEAMVSVKNTSRNDYAELTWSCDLFDKDHRLVGRGVPLIFTVVPKNAVTTDTQSVAANGIFETAQCTLIHAEQRSDQNERLFRASPKQVSWPARGVKHWWNDHRPADGEGKP